MKKYFMVVKHVSTGNESEEEIENIYVDETHPMFETHDVGVHSYHPSNLDDAKTAARSLIGYFNSTLKDGESEREIVKVFEKECK